jgi:predicted nuclease of restriction endonuclease-like (RecB) superfamily
MSTTLSAPDYPAFLTALKDRILRARVSAARAVNRDLVLLYWDIGRGIVEKQQTAGWGDAVVERLAADLRAEFPDMRGFSLQNLWRMKQLYLAHSAPELLAQAVREIEPAPRGTPAIEFLSQAVREMVAVVCS